MATDNPALLAEIDVTFKHISEKYFDSVRNIKKKDTVEQIELNQIYNIRVYIGKGVL